MRHAAKIPRKERLWGGWEDEPGFLEKQEKEIGKTILRWNRSMGKDTEMGIGPAQLEHKMYNGNKGRHGKK